MKRHRSKIAVFIVVNVFLIAIILGLPALRYSYLEETTSGLTAQNYLENNMYAEIAATGPALLTASSNKPFALRVGEVQISGQKSQIVPAGLSSKRYGEYYVIAPQPVVSGDRINLTSGDWADIAVTAQRGRASVSPHVTVSYWNTLPDYYAPAGDWFYLGVIGLLVIVMNLVFLVMMPENPDSRAVTK